MIAINKDIGANKEPGDVHVGIIDLNSLRTKLITDEKILFSLLFESHTVPGIANTAQAESQLKEKPKRDLGSNTENKLDIEVGS